MPGITIRRAAQEDAPALARLSGELGYPSSTEEVSGRLLQILDSSGDALFVASASDGRVVAWVHLFLTLRIESEKFAEVGGLVVEERRRGEGIARSLMEAAESWAMREGARRIRVRSRTTREEAHRFYERLGFTRIKRQEVFEKVLSP
jgi:GNAT superfamily N-acetyltransferase